MRNIAFVAVLGFALCARPTAPAPAVEEDGYDLWLRYRPITDAALLAEYRSVASYLVMPDTSPTLRAAKREILAGLGGLLGTPLPVESRITKDGAILVGSAASPRIAGLPIADELRVAGAEGFLLRTLRVDGWNTFVIAANTDVGVLHGVFAFLRRIQTHQAPAR